MPLKSFIINTGGFHFTEDLADAPKLSIKAPSTFVSVVSQHISVVDNEEAVNHTGGLFAQARPPTPYDHEVDPTQLANLPTITEGAHYPIYRGYERDEFLQKTDSWIKALSALHAAYQAAFQTHWNWFQRTQLPQYKKVIRRMERIVCALEEMVALLNARSKYADLPSGCSEVCRVLAPWIDSATEAFQDMVLLVRHGKKWRGFCFGALIYLQVTTEIMDLAFELKIGPLERVVGIVKILEKERDGRV